MGSRGNGVGFGRAFAVREFRALWAAEAFSQAGDQLARVALSVLVWERTSSAGLTGLTYGLTYLPTLIGGTVFAGFGDRYPRRAVMIVCDVVRAVVAAAMAIPGLPLPALCALLVVLTVAGGPFRAAQQALLPDVLEGESYVAGLAVRNITIQTAQLVGFGGGGVIIGLVNPYWGLVLDAVTFVLSALLVAGGVRRRPAADTSESTAKGRLAKAFSSTGAKVLWRDNDIRVLFWLKMLAGFAIAPEGLAAPFAGELGLGTFAVGLILAGDPVGSIVGAWVFTRWVPAERKSSLIGLLAVLSLVPLAFLLMHPPFAVCLALIAVSGACATPYHMQAVVLVARTVPDAVRAQVLGLTATSLVAVQGLGVMLAGLLAQFTGAAVAIGAAGVAGLVLAAPMAVAWQRATARKPDGRVPSGPAAG